MVKTLRPRIGNIDLRTGAPIDRHAGKETDPFYSSAAYVRWAEAVKERAGHRCESPDHLDHLPRTGVRLYADHIRERRDFPGLALDPANGMCVCGSCHSRKTWREKRRREGEPK